MTDLAWLLQERRDQIVATFVAEVVRTDLSPPGVGRMLLVDHIPRFLDEIIAELSHVSSVRFSHDAVDTSATARQHGEQRWSLGYDLEALIREYGILRHAILRTAREAGTQPTIDEFDVLAKCLSVGVAEAATEYVRYRDEQLDGQRSTLVFLAEAGQILSSSLDYRSTIATLTNLLVPRVADWCAVHLDGGDDVMPMAHVDPTKVAGLREALRASLAGVEPRMFPDDARIGEPELVRRVDPSATSWLSVPLRVQGHTFGAMTLVYADSGRHYEESDLLLAEDLARRAAVAIDNARLYDLSQKERSRVEASTRAKDEFVAMISHELRTPLNSILGWLRLMRAGNLDEARKEHALGVIERNAEAQGQLVSDLLDISRIISGKMRINPAQVDLANVVDMAIEGVRPAAEGKQISLDVEVDRSSTLIRGDGDRLQQVAWNLLANAVKFTPKHGHVTVRLRRVDSDVELRVDDDGEGIDADFLPHVFESFRQSDGGSSRSHGGLGIGLSIVKHLVELHGGSISAQSGGRGQGSTFVCRLPVSPLLSTTIGVSRVAPTKTTPSARLLPRGLEGVRVLVVDDEPDARELISHVLSSCGMDVRAAHSAAAALDELSRFTPHVILSDIGMPEEDGYHLVRSIRTHQDETRRNIPVIALTAFARNDDRTRALVEGFNLHLAKPVDPMELVRAVMDLSGSVSRP